MLFTIMAALGQMEHEIKRERIVAFHLPSAARAARIWAVARGSSPTAKFATPADSQRADRRRPRSRSTSECPELPSTAEHASWDYSKINLMATP